MDIAGPALQGIEEHRVDQPHHRIVIAGNAAQGDFLDGLGHPCVFVVAGERVHHPLAGLGFFQLRLDYPWQTHRQGHRRQFGMGLQPLAGTQGEGCAEHQVALAVDLHRQGLARQGLGQRECVKAGVALELGVGKGHQAKQGGDVGQVFRRLCQHLLQVFRQGSVVLSCLLLPLLSECVHRATPGWIRPVRRSACTAGTRSARSSRRPPASAAARRPC